MRIIEYIKVNAERVLMALILAGYGLAILARPSASIATIAFLEARLGLSHQAVAVLFISGAIAMLTSVHWLHYFALVPLIAYSIAAASFIIPRPDLTLVAVVQHVGLALLMLLIVERDWRRANGKR